MSGSSRLGGATAVKADLHSHILPCLDDGPDSLGTSLEMAERYVQAGYDRVVATPHWVMGSTWAPSPEAVESKVLELQAGIFERGMSLEVLPGMEVTLTNEIPRLLAEKRLLTLGKGPYLLLELPFQRLPWGWEQILFEIKARGYQILLAHPERCSEVACEPERLETLLRMGASLQINIKSLLGRYGEQVKRTAWNWMLGGKAHCLATDSHSPLEEHWERFGEIAGKLKGRMGAEAMETLLEGNPGRVLQGASLTDVIPDRGGEGPSRRGRFLRLFRKRDG